jgi:hypothetical protein
LAFTLLFSLTSCATNTNTRKDNADTNSHRVHTTEKESDYELLRNYIIENGGNYQGVYQVLHLETNSSTIISCTENGNIIFYFSMDGTYNTITTTLELFEDSDIQTVEFTYEQSGYTLTATGTLITSEVSLDDCPLYAINHTENFPSTVSSDSIQKIVDDIPLATQVMLSSVNAVILENVGISLSDLGFTNWDN